MIRFTLLVMIICLPLHGCDFVYGPDFVNGYKKEIVLTLTGNDGEDQIVRQIPCGTMGLAKTSPVHPSVFPVVKIKVSLDGQTVQIIDEDAIDDLVRRTPRTSEGGYKGFWLVDESGIQILEGYPCDRSLLLLDYETLKTLKLKQTGDLGD